jgi:L-threonylcarbamoyladenylate synthase
MRRLSVTAASPDPDVLREAAAALAQGLIVAYPTDTFYGLAADPRRADGVARVFAVKGRGAEAALPLVAADLDQASRAGRLTPLAVRLARLFWPGPLTLVIDAHPGLDPRVRGGATTVAVRVPAHDVARGLARAAGHAVTATSANRSGGPAARTAAEVAAALDDDVDLILDGGPSPGGPPSTIVDATGATPALLRAGAVPWERLLSALAE